MEKLMTLHYDNDGSPVEIVVQRATVRVGVQRYTMMSAADEMNKKNETDSVLATIRLFTFPTVVCGTLSVKGLQWPMGLEDFLELDEALVDAWLGAIYKMNPHWKGTSDTSEKTKNVKKETV